jgi:phosphoribosylanthranilate isomerase
VEEAWLAIRCGASAIVPPPIATFLLTCKQDAPSIIAQQRRCATNTIQICDRLEASHYKEMRAAMPGISLVQVIHVGGEESLQEAEEVALYVDAILLDSGNQSLPVKELGGTGRTHDWTISRLIRERVGVPVFLAGGLNSSNVREAFEMVRPFGIDVCSGVRTNDQLDERKLTALFSEIRSMLWP